MRKVLAAFLLVFALLICNPANISGQSGGGSTGTQRSGNPNVKVWVNTPTSVYHCPGARWYGSTKTGVYMTQKEAQNKGNRPAYGKYCE
jgi:hypothetical protein